MRDITGTDEGKPQYADLSSRTPNLPVLLACRADPKLKRRISEAWSFGSLGVDKVRELGTAVLVSGALDEAIAMMNRELDAAVEVLGEYGETPLGENLVHWARTLARGMTLKGAA